jgi:hypothetical protein
MNQRSNKQAGTTTPRTKQRAEKPSKKPAAKQDGDGDPSHKQRFEQLLGDVVLGVPPKR